MAFVSRARRDTGKFGPPPATDGEVRVSTPAPLSPRRRARASALPRGSTTFSSIAASVHPSVRLTAPSPTASSRPAPSSQAVGPGAYGEDRASPTYQGVAPFYSTSRRTSLSDGADRAPGPGAHALRSSFAGAQKRATKTFSAFVSGQSRLGKLDTTDAVDNPGPGHYEGANASRETWPRKPANRWKSRSTEDASSSSTTTTTTTTKPTRVTASAPSVPTKSQSYGYAVTPDGGVVPRAPPIRGCSGVKGDTVGPAGYAPVGLGTAFGGSKTAGTDFVSSKSKRGFELARERGTLGDGPPSPGTSYLGEVKLRVEEQLRVSTARRSLADADANANLNPRRSGSGSPTRTTCEREPSGANLGTRGGDARVMVDAVPGPGAYAAPSQFDRASRRKQSKPSRLQNFNVSSPASYQVDAETSLSAPTWATTPGPGAYEDPRVRFKTRDGERPFRVASAKKTTATGDRSPAPPAAKKWFEPGPGQYDLGGMAKDVDRKLGSKNGVFGSSAARFGPGIVREPRGGGVGDRADDDAAESAPGTDGTLARLRRKETSSFASTSKRGGGSGSSPAASPSPSSSPPPLPSSFQLDGAPTRPSNPYQAPPPGAYDVVMNAKWLRKGTTRGTLGGEARFKESGGARDAASSPGPGSYEWTTGKKAAKERSTPTLRSSFRSGTVRFGEDFGGDSPGPDAYDTGGSMNVRSFNVTAR